MGRLARWPELKTATAAASTATQGVQRTTRAPSDGRVGLAYRRLPPWTRVPPRRPERAAMKVKPSTLDSTDWDVLPAKALKLEEVPSPHDPGIVPFLAHGLSRVLRQRGVHLVNEADLHVAARRSESLIVNGNRYRSVLGSSVQEFRRIPQPNEINWSALPPYVPASQDRKLRSLALSRPGIRYSGSTSSMTSVLATLYHAVSNFKHTLLLGGLTRSMADLPGTFTRFHRHPTAIAVRPYPEIAGLPSDAQSKFLFSIDSHSGPDHSPPILRDLGHAMERMLTMPGDEFRQKILLKEPLPPSNSSFSDMHSMESISIGEPGVPSQFYHYTEAASFLLRAQIDCRDDYTNDVFDVKTRAVAAIRYNLRNYLSNTHRILRRLTGTHNSYEREFYDMVRSVFLKYALQLRIGRMSGAFVTYHNTSKVLGFEFVTLREIEAYVFGSETWTEQAFSGTVRLLGNVLDEITEAMPVTHPDYLKVVVSVHYSKKCIHVYAQRVRADEDDPLGGDKFMTAFDVPYGQDGGEGLADLECGDAKEMIEFSNNPCTRPGFSVVSQDIIGTDVERLASMTEAGSRTSEFGRSHLRDHRRNVEGVLMKSAELAPGDLRGWELSLAHFVNGNFTSDPIELHPADDFEMRYRLLEREGDERSLRRDFIAVLNSTYFPQSRN